MRAEEAYKRGQRDPPPVYTSRPERVHNYRALAAAARILYALEYLLFNGHASLLCVYVCVYE